MTLSIAVAVKVVPKPEEVTLDEETMTIDREDADSELNPADKNAVELALSIRDELGEDEVDVVAVSMGPPFWDEQLQDVIAMGVDDAYLLSDRAFAGADTHPTSRVLSAGVEEIRDVDLVLCGEESSDSSTGQVPAGVAEWLGYNLVTYVDEIAINDQQLETTRTVSGGEETVRVPLPTVASVEYGVNEPRFPDFKRKRWAENEWEPTVWDAEKLGLVDEELGLEGSYTEVDELESIEGPDRLEEWIEGDPGEQAAVIADVIERRLG